MKALTILALCSVLVLQTACKKSESERVQSLPDFSVSDDERAKLKEVGCELRSSSVECSDPAVTDSRDPMQNLRSAKKMIEKQKQAVEEVRASIKKRLSAGSFSPSSQGFTSILLVQLNLKAVGLISQATDIDISLINEQNYQTVLGFQCEGNFQANGNTTKINHKMYFDPDGKEITTFIPASETGLVATMQLFGTKTAAWKMADSQQAANQTFRQFVQSDGEFIINTQGDKALALSCLRLRVSPQTAPFTDRPVQSNYLKCNVLSEKDGKPRRWSMSFPASLDHKADSTELTMPTYDKEMNERPELRFQTQKYGERVVSDKGILKFTIYDLVTGATLTEVSTTNRTSMIRIDFDDTKGNSVTVDCRSEK